MHKDPSQRYQWVEVIIRDVNNQSGGRAAGACRDSLRYVTVNLLRICLLLSVAAAVAILLTLVVIYTVKLDARPGAVVQAARTRRIQNFMPTRFMAAMLSGGAEQEHLARGFCSLSLACSMRVASMRKPAAQAATLTIR